MKTLSEAFIKNDDSSGGTFHLMKKMSEMEKMAALTGKIFGGKDWHCRKNDTNQTTSKEECNVEDFQNEIEKEDDLSTYEGRAWEDLSDDELCEITEAGENFGYDCYESRCSKKAKEVMVRRVEEGLAFLKKPIADDGSIRGLLANGDYGKTGKYVMIQQFIDGETVWFTSYRKDEMSISAKKWSTENEYYPAINSVAHSDKFDESEQLAADIVTICRRKFKKEDIIICIFGSYNQESGIVFLEDKICSFDSKKLEYIITYAEMEDIDFTEDSVTISVSSGEEVSLYCGDDEEYSKGVYNLLMDIKDRLVEA